jgi:purine-cytosine permease-like protein
MHINHFLSLIGLLLDIIGAFFLAKSFIFKKIEAIKKEGSMNFPPFFGQKSGTRKVHRSRAPFGTLLSTGRPE